ncbi:MAG TPA: putative peptidoglycan glycosyltransferase FtsW [Bryobacteraceae bacterium]|nr:putative peptidoglycan glycosyltransferase FtsW [Bryobacteraceae bacterium]
MAQRLRTDWTLFFTVVAMVCFGLVMVYSASSVTADIRYHDTTRFFLRQLGWAVISFAAMMWLKRHDYRLLKSSRWAFLPLSIVLILLVVVYFLDGKTHRWFHFGIASFQPSEFAKPVLAIFLAWFVDMRKNAINTKHTIVPASMALGGLAIAVAVADLGTAIVLVLTATVVFYVAGLDRRFFVTALCVLMLFSGIAIISKPYRIARVVGFIPHGYEMLAYFDKSGSIRAYLAESKTSDTGYQALQSKIAVGSGGALGVGLMQGRQKLFYLPEAHTDFIYAVVGEELGLFGCTAVLAGFLLLLWRGLRLYWLSPDDFGRYLALALTSSIFFQALINMSVVVGLGPTKGIPLPMISFGGSSLLATLIACGLLLSVSDRSG